MKEKHLILYLASAFIGNTDFKMDFGKPGNYSKKKERMERFQRKAAQ